MKQKYIFLFSEILSKGLNFSILMFLPLLLSAEVYGDLAYAWTVDLILVELLGFGQTHYIIRYYNNAVNQNRVVLNSILIVFLGTFISLLVTSIFDISIGSISIVLLIISSAFQSVINIIATEYRVINHILAYSKLRIINILGKCLIYFFVAFNYYYFTNIFIIFYLLIGYYIIIILFSIRGKYKFINWSIREFQAQYKKSASIFFHVIAGILLVSADKLLAPFYFTNDIVGKYIFNLQIVGGSFIAVNLISLWILPRAFANDTKTKYKLRGFLFWGLFVTVLFNVLFHYVGIDIIEYYKPTYLLTNSSYYFLYIITILSVYQNYIYYLFLWKNKVYLEAIWTAIIAIIIAITYQYWDLLSLNDLLNHVIIYNIVLVLGGIVLYIHVSKKGLFTFIGSKCYSVINKF